MSTWEGVFWHCLFSFSIFFSFFFCSFFCVVLSFPITMLIPGGQGPEVGVTEALLCCFFFVCFFSWLDHYSCSKSSLCYLEGWLFFFGKIKVFCSFLSKQHGFSKGSCKETIYLLSFLYLFLFVLYLLYLFLPFLYYFRFSCKVFVGLDFSYTVYNWTLYLHAWYLIILSRKFIIIFLWSFLVSFPDLSQGHVVWTHSLHYLSIQSQCLQW